MTVIQISEDNHGLIGIAKDYKSAIDFLFNNHWIEDSTEIWAGDFYYQRLDEALGEDWLDKMTSWDVENFNDFWENSFLLTKTEVYGG